MTSGIDERHIEVSAGADRAAVNHLLASTAFLAFGGEFVVLSFLSLAFPDNLTGALAYGRVRPMGMTVILLGWLIPALVGGVYYILPRLTGAPLWNENLARAGMWVMGTAAILGVAVHGLGLGDGVEPLALPWWLDIVVLVGVSIPTLVTIQTLRKRNEAKVFVSLWFAMAGVTWLPILYVFGNLPGLSALGRELGAVHFEAGLITMWAIGIGTGIVYYTVPKATGNPLSNRQLAHVGFWSLVFAATWMGPLRLTAGPLPGWLIPVSVTFTLALVVGTLANLVAINRTIGDTERTPHLRAATWGLAFALFVAIGASAAGIGSAPLITGLTAFWDGISYAAIFGAGGLLSAAWIYQAMPSILGRRMRSTINAERHIRWTVVGVAGTASLLMITGIIQGFAWTGAAFTGGFEAPADAWAATSSIPTLLFGLTSITALIAFVAQIFFVVSVFRTTTSGQVTEQEILVLEQRPS